MRSIGWTVPLALVFAVGCVDADPTVMVEAAIAEPALTVSSSSLVTTLDGTFRLTLHLGPRASGSSQVTLGKFALATADQAQTLVDPLEVTTVTAFPVDVEPNSDAVVDFVIATPDAPADATATICAADGLRISGTIQDSLQDGLTPAVSGIFYPTCM